MTETRTPETKQEQLLKPNSEQTIAIEILKSNNNVFLTGPAGVGKSFVINQFIDSRETKPVVLASTGVAAVLIKGRTFNSFFGLGIMEGGISNTLARALKIKKVKERLKEVKEVVIDEISMIPAEAFFVASLIAQNIRNSSAPFGGIRIVVVGDFLQIPPVNPKSDEKWLFQTQTWNECEFKVITLTKTMRTSDEPFIDILKKIRFGVCDDKVKDFFNSRMRPLSDDFVGTVIFGRKNQVEDYNNKKLNQNPNQIHKFETEIKIFKTKSYQQTPETLINQSPIPPVLYLKVGALVMIRKNDIEGKYVNGSLGFVSSIGTNLISVKLLANKHVTIEPEVFQILDAGGDPIAEITNFPLTLGWATTIHKAQGSSIDRVHMNLKNLWESGQAYVAVSRAKDPNQLFIEDWSTSSIKVDQNVIQYYQNQS
jgi:ATP-dependent exoDNAse (exonuclease V) alpha subunit